MDYKLRKGDRITFFLAAPMVGLKERVKIGKVGKVFHEQYDMPVNVQLEAEILSYKFKEMGRNSSGGRTGYEQVSVRTTGPHKLENRHLTLRLGLDCSNVQIVDRLKGRGLGYVSLEVSVA